MKETERERKREHENITHYIIYTWWKLCNLIKKYIFSKKIKTNEYE